MGLFVSSVVVLFDPSTGMCVDSPCFSGGTRDWNEGRVGLVMMDSIERRGRNECAYVCVRNKNNGWMEMGLHEHEENVGQSVGGDSGNRRANVGGVELCEDRTIDWVGVETERRLWEINDGAARVRGARE
jgi:hypothetical protein